MSNGKGPAVAEVRNLNAERDEELVSVLEEWLELAKKGHFSDVCFIGKVRGASMTEFHWDGESPVEVVGALELAKAEVIALALDEVNGDTDEDPEGE